MFCGQPQGIEHYSSGALNSGAGKEVVAASLAGLPRGKCFQKATVLKLVYFDGEHATMSEVEFEDDVETDVMNHGDYDLDGTGETFDIEEFLAMGINPVKSTKAKPGTEEKVLMLSARYAAGLPLWHDRDCYDHGPKERELMGAASESLPQPLPLPESDDEE